MNETENKKYYHHFACAYLLLLCKSYLYLVYKKGIYAYTICLTIVLYVVVENLRAFRSAIQVVQ